MKKILLIVLTTTILFGWEINTHRAIDREAIAKAINLNLFSRSHPSSVGMHTRVTIAR
jgi:hypothetical protein